MLFSLRWTGTYERLTITVTSQNNKGKTACQMLPNQLFVDPQQVRLQDLRKDKSLAENSLRLLKERRRVIAHLASNTRVCHMKSCSDTKVRDVVMAKQRSNQEPQRLTDVFIKAKIEPGAPRLLWGAPWRAAEEIRAGTTQHGNSFGTLQIRRVQSQ
ncbi:hypothetical protein RRG08_011611 [Elysia crispata]|uniref:Uncharacterized protein n=1 Tax=Elysia crispata TaxID=231223 RepID=A0AAE0XPQ7_9GAST|nr:hypothetical protein RRG08_011611 [Elysia crispata]